MVAATPFQEQHNYVFNTARNLFKFNWGRVGEGYAYLGGRQRRRWRRMPEIHSPAYNSRQ